jgi:MFS family permease
MSHGLKLDALNFLLADVRGGLGAYVGVFLLTRAGWDQETLGAVLTASGLIGIAAHVPIGATIDATRAKRGLLIVAMGLLSACALAIVFRPTLPVVFAADVTMAMLGAVFAPVVAALTMGLVPAAALAARFSRNAAFDKAGNLCIAALAAVVGTQFGQEAVFWLTPLFAILTLPVLMGIPSSAIDHARARGFTEGVEVHAAPEAVTSLLRRRKFLLLALLVMAFHFTNAPLLNMVSQKLALSHPGQESALTSGAVIVAQMATIPVALLLARSDVLGRKPFLIVALAALPARAALFAATDSPVLLLAGQVLDGVGAGLLDALLPLLLADLMRGSGRYTAARGLLGTMQGVGGSLSNVVTGMLIVRAGYDFTFAALAVLGVVVLAAGWAFMPETLSRPPRA